MSRDTALILLAGVITVIAMICTTVLVIEAEVDPVAALGIISAGGVGIAGMAIGRLSGTGTTVNEGQPPLPLRQP